LIVAPLIFLLGVIIVRVWLEIIIVVFRIAEYLRDMAGERPSWDVEPHRTE
jgi:Domain of unknown function (DUF4282)